MTLTVMGKARVEPGHWKAVSVPTDSGRPHLIHRCPECKVALWSHYGGVERLCFIQVGALDDPATLTPDVHIYTRSKLPWVALPPGVPALEAITIRRRSGHPKALSGAKAIFG
jgi:hypothetical protein